MAPRTSARAGAASQPAAGQQGQLQQQQQQLQAQQLQAAHAAHAQAQAQAYQQQLQLYAHQQLQPQQQLQAHQSNMLLNAQGLNAQGLNAQGLSLSGQVGMALAGGLGQQTRVGGHLSANVTPDCSVRGGNGAAMLGPGLVALQRDLEKQAGFHKWLMDMLPQPIFCACGRRRHTVPQPGHIGGRRRIARRDDRALAAHATRRAQAEQSRQRVRPGRERQRRRRARLAAAALSSTTAGPPLPAPTEGHSVLVQDTTGAQRSILSMHRVPFWMADSTGVQHAVVMYISC